jgi:hypothetical protein
MVKRRDTTGSWYIFDNTRSTFNVVKERLVPNTTAAEATNYNVFDFLSNGFKLKDTNGEWNASGGSYIYMTFAENPLVTTGKIPATAR